MGEIKNPLCLDPVALASLFPSGIGGGKDSFNTVLLRRPLEPGQYTSIAFGLRCKEVGVRPSMGSVGDAYDNAMCESFFATLECELLDRKPLHTQVEARMAVFDFIEGWYNPHRRHSSIGYQSPNAFERDPGGAKRGGSAPEPPLINEPRGRQEGPAHLSAQLSTKSG